jgi:predicted RNA-binding Zn-ribbon protein involved in translation (DUF1610 family)
MAPMKFNLIPSVVCPNCGKVSELPPGDQSDPFPCPKCNVTSTIGKKDLRLLKPEEFEASAQV